MTPSEFTLSNEAPRRTRKATAPKCYAPLDAPVSASLSGGRTSGYMLRKYLDSGRTPDYVLFCNTGKERDETLDFVHDIETRWTVPVVWLEYRRSGRMDVVDDKGHGVRIVSYETAHRTNQPGGPFDELLQWANVLPNVANRVCSVQMKVRTMRRYLQLIQGHEYWQAMIGYRADESHRPIETDRYTPGYVRNLYPLIEMGVTVEDVDSFWKANDFDLKLESYEGNCDLCFLKKRARIVRLIRKRPDAARWWAKAEAMMEAKLKTSGDGGRFRKDRPGYAALLAMKDDPTLLDDIDDEVPCGCMSEGAWRGLEGDD